MVYATGFSNGAMMAYQIAIDHPDLFAAVAPVEGSVHLGYLSSNITLPNQPISVLDIHGISDTTIPSNYTISDDYWLYDQTWDIINVFATINKCKGPHPTVYSQKFTGGVNDIWCKTF